MNNILFVCTGNTCRSPMAEAILKSKNIPGVKVRSAGVYAADGYPAAQHAQQVLQEEKMDHQHQSAMLTKDLINWATYIFTMTESHKESVIYMFPEGKEKTFTLKEFAGHEFDWDIIDPFGGSLEMYRKTYKDIRENIDKIVERLED